MKHLLTTLFLFPILFSMYGFVILPHLLQSPELTFISLFTFVLESMAQLVIGYVICVPVSIIFSSLLFKKIGNLWCGLTFAIIIALLYIISIDALSQILCILLPAATIIHYHLFDIKEMMQSFQRDRLE